VAEPVRKVTRVVEVFDVREFSAKRSVAQEHRGVHVRGAEREVLGHALDEPERRADGEAERLVLKRVDDLVPQHVIGFTQARGEGQHDAPPQAFRDAARGGIDESFDDVGLFEVRVRRKQHERLAARELKPQQRAETQAPALRHPRGHRGRGFFFRVEVDVEMLGAQRLEVESFVGDFVLAEVLGRSRRGDKAAQDGRKGGGRQRSDVHMLIRRARCLPRPLDRRRGPRRPHGRIRRVMWAIRCPGHRPYWLPCRARTPAGSAGRKPCGA
jgi:hypothetical protein